MLQEHVVSSVKTVINLSYPFEKHNADKLHKEVVNIIDGWNSSLSSQDASLFTENHVMSIIYELIENPLFQYKDIGGPQVFT